jgi:murein hydrolase activator
MRARRTSALSLGFVAAILVGAAPAQAQSGAAKTAVERALMAISTAERSRDPGAAAAAAAAARQARNLLRASPLAAPMAPQKRSWPAAGRVIAAAGRPGVAIRTEPGALVLAPAGGVVRFAGPVAGYNQVLILDQGRGYASVLTGLESAFVGPGDAVGRAEPLGQMPKSPASIRRSAPALYFEVRSNGAPIDPRRWLRGEDQSGAAIASKSPQSGAKVLSRAAAAPVG